MTGFLTPWIEHLLGIQTEPGEGTVWTLEHTWNWAPWFTLLFVVFAEMFVLAVYLRESRRSSRLFRAGLAQIRVLLVLLVLFMLAQYALSLQKTGLPYVAVLVDDSLSMTTVDRYEGQIRDKLDEQIQAAGFDKLSRWNLARTILVQREGALLKGISNRYKLRLYFVTAARQSRSESPDDLVEEVNSLMPSGESTRLGTAVRTVLDDLRGTAPAALVLISDGINTEGADLSDAAAYARRKGVPLFTVALGDDRPVQDLELGDLLVEEAVFVDDIVNFEFKLTGTGFAGRKVQIVLREKDKPQVLASMKATVAADGHSQRLRLPYRPREVRKIPFVVEVEALKGESDTKNNREDREVTVSDQKVRVLLASASPNYEFRYLANMLDRDGSIELNTVLQGADPEHASQDTSALKGFPVRRDDLFKYDVVILGDVDPALLSVSMMQNLVDFVCDQAGPGRRGKGGSLVFIAGPNYMPLAYRDTPIARLMPVELASAVHATDDDVNKTGFVIQPTELGLQSPQMQLGDTPGETLAIWENLPPLYWFAEFAEVRPGARVLAQHPDSLRPGQDGRRAPLICMQYVGAGKVLFHATDETWRWRWRVGDVIFARYWVQTLRFLSRSKLSKGQASAVLSADRREYERGELVRLRVRFADERLAPAADDGVTVVLEHKGGKTRRIKLHRDDVGRGVFEGVLSKPSIGSYHAWLAIPTLEGRAPTVDFQVVSPPGEFRRVQTDTAEMKRVADRTKGRFYTFFDAAELLDNLPPGRQVPIESPDQTPLWNTWPVLLLFLILLTAEWLLRKWGAMV